MKTIRSSILCFVVLLLTAPLLRAQGLSKYRNFSFGMSLTTVLKHTDQRMADVRAVHQRPALIQELTWWPPHIPQTSSQSDTVQEILFSFYDGELYRISVAYDRNATEGLTAEDMVQSISAKYGPSITSATEISLPANGKYESTQKVLARWEDSQYSFNLLRSSFSDGFGLVIFSKTLNAQAEVGIAEALKLDAQEGPQREAERQKKETNDLEVTRQKNRKTFRP